MHFVEGQEGRFELALSTSVLNELKYGSQLNSLAESLLLSAFSNNSVEPVLQREIATLLPAVKYIRWKPSCRSLLSTCLNLTYCVRIRASCVPCQTNILSVQLGSFPQRWCGDQKQ